MKKLITAFLTLLILSTATEESHNDHSIYRQLSLSAKTAEAFATGSTARNYYSWGSCAYYAFNRRAQMGKPVSNQWGNAKYWASNAKRSGYTVKRKPRYGAVMVSKAGYYGHVAVVERVNKNGSYLVSEMNFPRLGVKTYRTLSKSQASAYQFIY